MQLAADMAKEAGMDVKPQNVSAKIRNLCHAWLCVLTLMLKATNCLIYTGGPCLGGGVWWPEVVGRGTQPRGGRAAVSSDRRSSCGDEEWERCRWGGERSCRVVSYVRCHRCGAYDVHVCVHDHASK